MRTALPRVLTRRGRAVFVASCVVPLALVLALTASPAGGVPTSPGLYPDLQTVVPRHLQIVNSHQRDILRFSNGIANTGDGPWALRPENAGGVTNAIQEIRDADGQVVREELVSTFEFHPAHNHWHIADIAQFDIRKGSPTGPLAADASIKVTFCLIDWYALEGNSSTSDRTFWECQTSYQGIKSGWVDQYHQSLPGQELDLTGAPNRNDYYLVSTANPDGIFTETTRTNNTAWVKFRLFAQGNGRAIEVTAHSPCSTPGLCGVGAPGR